MYLKIWIIVQSSLHGEFPDAEFQIHTNFNVCMFSTHIQVLLTSLINFGGLAAAWPFFTEEEFDESLTLNHLTYELDIVNDTCTSHFKVLHDLEQLKVYENIVY